MAAESLSGHQALPVPPTSQIQEGKGFFEIRKEKGQFPYLPEKPTTGHYFPVQSKGHARADTPAFPYTHTHTHTPCVYQKIGRASCRERVSSPV